MKTAQQVWEEAYPDRRKWNELEQDTRDEWERVVKIAQNNQPFFESMIERPFHP